MIFLCVSAKNCWHVIEKENKNGSISCSWCKYVQLKYRSHTYIWDTDIYKVINFFFYKRSNHEESFCAMKINHKNLEQ